MCFCKDSGVLCPGKGIIFVYAKQIFDLSFYLSILVL